MGLDPHSMYLTEDAYQGLQDSTSGEFTGLGLEVGTENGYVKIIAPSMARPQQKQACKVATSFSNWITFR